MKMQRTARHAAQSAVQGINQNKGTVCSSIEIFSICSHWLNVLDSGKVQEVGGAMHLVVEFLRISQLQLIVHVGRVAHTCRISTCAFTIHSRYGTHTTPTHEVVVPRTLSRHHEKRQESIREEHLHLLVVGGEVAVGVVPRVFVAAAPVIARGRELVGSQGAGPRSETAHVCVCVVCVWCV